MLKFNQFKKINEATDNTSSMKEDLDDFFINYLDAGKATSRFEKCGVRTPQSKKWIRASFKGSKADTTYKYWLTVFEYSIVIKDYISKEKIVNIIEKIKGVIENIDILSYDIKSVHYTDYLKSSDETKLELHFSFLESELDVLSKRTKQIINKLRGLGLKKERYGDWYTRIFTERKGFKKILFGKIENNDFKVFYESLMKLMIEAYGEPKSRKNEWTWQGFHQKITNFSLSGYEWTNFEIKFRGGSVILINMNKSGNIRFDVDVKKDLEKQTIRVKKRLIQ